MLCLVIQCIIMIHHVQCVLRSLSPSRFLSLSMFVFLEGLAHMMMAEQGTLTFPFLKRLYCVMHSLRVFFLNANFFFLLFPPLVNAVLLTDLPALLFHLSL